MRRLAFFFVFAFVILLPFGPAEAGDIADRLKGRILLQVESRGEEWYVCPDTGKRHYLGSPADAFDVMRNLGLGAKHDFITSHDIFPERVFGKILLDVERRGEAYYIFPGDGRKYYLGRPADAFAIMRAFGLGISNNDLDKIETVEAQAHDSCANCLSGYLCEAGKCVVKRCREGTPYGRCSPGGYMCSNGILAVNVPLCGCPIGSCDDCLPGYECESCACIRKKCSDGTPYGQCSTDTSRYCDNGILANNISLCGCPAGYKQDDGRCLDTVVFEEAKNEVVENFDFENESPFDSWTTEAWNGVWNMEEAVFAWEDSMGRSGSRSISISSSESNDAQWKYKIDLDPGKIYRLSGYIKGEEIVNADQRGTMGASLWAQEWDHTEDITGTFDWKRFSVDFTGGPAAEIKCRLGGYAVIVTGKAWFDDLVIQKDPLSKYEGENIFFLLEDDDLLSISPTNMKQWVINMDKAYEAYVDLVGFEPFDGQKIGIMSVGRYPGGWAVAGNPIKWHRPYVADQLARVDKDGDWSFGIMHEIGHDFDLDAWNWDAEFWANFKMYYVVEKLDAKVSLDGVYYIGSQLLDFYKRSEGQFDENGTGGLTYKLLTIKDRIGWEPFRQAFRYLAALPADEVLEGRLDRFNLFIEQLSRFSGEDIAGMFSESEMDAIRLDLSK